MLFLAMAFCSAEGFTTKKKDGSPHFSATNQPKEQQHDKAPFPASDTARFAFVPGTGQREVVQYFEPDEEEDVSYSVALVACMLSLAVGFGLGYGT